MLGFKMRRCTNEVCPLRFFPNLNVIYIHGVNKRWKKHGGCLQISVFKKHRVFKYKVFCMNRLSGGFHGETYTRLGFCSHEQKDPLISNF